MTIILMTNPKLNERILTIFIFYLYFVIIRLLFIFCKVNIMLFLIICRTGIKIGVVVAVLKVSYHLDIWSLDSNQGAQKLIILKETVVPGMIVFPKEVCIYQYQIVFLFIFI